MRTSLFSLALALLVASALVGCASTQAHSDADATADAVHNPDRVDADDFDGRPIARVEEMLRGQVAGVTVRETPSGLVVRIRGASSIFANSDPLFIVDGLPFELGMDGVLTGINPRDVASIEVLKNASDTAMYGSRGANGVILITTKRPPSPAPPTEDGSDGSMVLGNTG